MSGMTRRKFAFSGAAFVMSRQFLTSTAQRFVDFQNGDDGNDGLSAETPHRSLQYAYERWQRELDLGGQILQILCSGNLTAAYALSVTGPWVGQKRPESVSIIGNGTLNCSGQAVYAVQDAKFQIEGFTITAGSNAIYAGEGTFIKYGGLTFGACGAAHIDVSKKATTLMALDCTIGGDAPYHVLASNGGNAIIASRTITISGSRTFASAFAAANQAGNITGHSAPGIPTFVNKANVVSTKRYDVRNLSIVTGDNAVPDYWPGDQAGTCDASSKYM